jgi:sugar/nucleoside kinase (ribokinase family)
MTLVDGARAAEIEQSLTGWRQVAGGSAANTAVGVASLGGHPVFVGAVGDDDAGRWYALDLLATNVRCSVSQVRSGLPTGSCHVLVTPEGNRTMATSLGAAGEIQAVTVAGAGLDTASVLYLEGYLLDAEAAQPAVRKALEIAKNGGTIVALTLSDAFVVERHRTQIADLVFGGAVDLVFGNEEEACGITGSASLPEALARLRREGTVAVVTRGASGAVAVTRDGEFAVAADRVDVVQDTTGAGDLFAAGCLYSITHGHGVEQSLRVGSYAAAEIISHFGARPAIDLADAAPAGLLAP